MKVKIPFITNRFIRKTSHAFIGIGDVLIHMFPSMDLAVDYSGVKEKYNISGREYMAFAFTTTLLFSLYCGAGMMFVLVLIDSADFLLGASIAGIFGIAMFVSLMMYPKRIVGNRVKYVERNLLYALRSILVQIRSGVPVFNSMASIATGNYGPISTEFKNVIEKVNAGESMTMVLEELAVRNPSIYFRRALWQLVNSLKSGSDVGENLQDVINSLSKEQLVEIRRYKSILNPLAMMYMMVAVIVPSLGITLLIILSSFPGMEAIGQESIFWSLLAGVGFMQFIFMGLIKSKRPNIIGA